MHLFKNYLLMMTLVLACFPVVNVFCEDPLQTPVIPQTLLKLIHAPEVQKELGLQIDDDALLAVLREIDGPWWRSRNLPEEKQRKVIGEIEKKLLTDLKSRLKEDKFKRLREIEVQSQGTRYLASKGVAKAVGLSSSQSQEIQKVFLETDKLARNLLENPTDQNGLEMELTAVRETEQRRLNELLTPAQRISLGKLIGTPFDTASLTRIFPLAPELIDSGEWTGKGYIRSWWQGELNWQGATGDKTIETLIDQLLAESP